MDKVIPLEDRVLAKKILPPEKTSCGIIVPDNHDHTRTRRMEVLAVGPGLRSKEDGSLIPIAVSVGDIVIADKYIGTEIDIDGESHVMIKESDLMALEVQA